MEYFVGTDPDGQVSVFRPIARFVNADDAVWFARGRNAARKPRGEIPVAKAQPCRPASNVPDQPVRQPPPCVPTSTAKVEGEVSSLPSIKTFDTDNRDAFPRRIVAGEKPTAVALSMGVDPGGVRGWLSGAAVKARREELNMEATAASDSGAIVPVAPSPNSVRIVDDTDPDGPLGRGPARVGIPPSSAALTECASCGKAIMACADAGVDPRCARCSVG